MNYCFRTRDHPEADSRKAQPGEEQFPLYLPLEDEGELTIYLGRRGMVTLSAVLLCHLQDDPTLYAEALREAGEIRSTS